MSDEQESSPLGLRISEVAKILGVSVGTVRRWSESGHLRPYTTPGGHRRYSREELDRFIQEIREGAS